MIYKKNFITSLTQLNRIMMLRHQHRTPFLIGDNKYYLSGEPHSTFIFSAGFSASITIVSYLLYVSVIISPWCSRPASIGSELVPTPSLLIFLNPQYSISLV